MLKEKNRITIRQTFIIFIAATLSPTIRVFPHDSARLGHEAAWIAPIISAVVLFLICMVLNTFFQNRSIKDLGDVFNLSLGKTPGKILLILYLFWVIILYFLYIRYYAERLLSSIFPNTDIRFFIFVISIVVYMTVRGKIEAFARFCEILILVFTLVMAVFFIGLTPTIRAVNLWPITYYDLVPAVQATYPILGIWGYITLMFFWGDHIINKDQTRKQSKPIILFMTVMATAMMIFVVGSLGYQMAERMPLPFFSATKLVSLMETLDRFETVLLSIWVISDFIVITVFAIIIKSIVRSLFAVSEPKYFASPIILMGYFGSQLLAKNRFELEIFSTDIGLPLNIVFCFVIPILVLGIGKLRKKI